jgi:hypothetical protein
MKLACLACAAGALFALATSGAHAVESWNSPCLLDIRQIKEDWTRISTPQLQSAVAREVTRAEQSYRRGREQECQQRVDRIKEMMK